MRSDNCLPAWLVSTLNEFHFHAQYDVHEGLQHYLHVVQRVIVRDLTSKDATIHELSIITLPDFPFNAMLLQQPKTMKPCNKPSKGLGPTLMCFNPPHTPRHTPTVYSRQHDRLVLSLHSSSGDRSSARSLRDSNPLVQPTPHMAQ